ncbi:MAG TPA: hypothetical protein VGA62_11540 [Acidimicrobiia bacterium]
MSRCPRFDEPIPDPSRVPSTLRPFPAVTQADIAAARHRTFEFGHPIHIHLDFMRVLRRNGRVPPVNERDGVAKKDTWIADPPPGDPREPPPLEAGAVRAEPRCPSRPAAP